MFKLNAAEPQLLEKYLRSQHWLGQNESIRALSKPGEGNMNYVLRVETGSRTFILKQSRAYVEKYPQVPAPVHRVLTEGAFYKKVAENQAVQSFMPQFFGLDADNFVLVLEDLGEASDFGFLFDLQKKLTPHDVKTLVNYLHLLHQNFFKENKDEELANHEMRKLNHEHIFHYPFLENNGFDLNSIQAGLQDLSMIYKKDEVLIQKINALGKVYLSNGHYLLHGDFYPGSWLKTEQGIKIIDPEFCFYGCREFDLGVMLAHLYLTEQNPDLIDVVKKNYPNFSEINTARLYQFMGIEIMRRLIGLAQLPLKTDLKTKRKQLKYAHQLITQYEGYVIGFTIGDIYCRQFGCPNEGLVRHRHHDWNARQGSP